MNQSHTGRESAERSIASSAMTTRLSGPWLFVARAAWLALVLCGLGLLMAAFPSFYQQLQAACVGPAACNVPGALPAQGFHDLLALGLSPNAYAAFNTLFWAGDILIWSAIGLVIFLRRSDDWLALLAAFTLVMFNIGVVTPSLALGHPALTLPITLVNFLGQLSLVLLFLLFPDGRFVPRWTRLIVLPGVLQAIMTAAPPTSPVSVNNVPNWLNGLPSLLIYGSVIFSQIYRYRRVSTPDQRQQTKWVVFGILVIVAGFIVLAPLFSALGIAQANTPLAVFESFIYPLLLLLLPVCTCIAILRYRLYDIDRVINRALVYGLLTGVLAAIYFGLIFGLQFLLRGIINTQNDVALVVSTLAIAAVFRPLRLRIQRVIDRRFYRRKYDAARTLAAFSASLRSEVDLDQLSKELLATVDETMQPAHVSLWLRFPARGSEVSSNRERSKTREEGL